MDWKSIKQNLKKVDKVIMDQFEGIRTFGDAGDTYLVPIYYKTDDKCENAHVPFINYYSTKHFPSGNAMRSVYNLRINTIFHEGMNQILAQFIEKFTPTLVVDENCYLTLKEIDTNPDKKSISVLRYLLIIEVTIKDLSLCQ